jgi:hypothetical protein
LKEHLNAVLNPTFVVTNPVKNARGILKIDQEATPADVLIKSEISELRERMKNMEFRERQASLFGIARPTPSPIMSEIMRGVLEEVSHRESAVSMSMSPKAARLDASGEGAG